MGEFLETITASSTNLAIVGVILLAVFSVILFSVYKGGFFKFSGFGIDTTIDGGSRAESFETSKIRAANHIGTINAEPDSKVSVTQVDHIGEFHAQ